MNLEGVDKIASSLLNFESSISAELEAELITGKALNLEKARQAALDNDLATVATEISRQVGSSADYSKMHRKEQEALAKAVGMSRDELAGSLVAQEMKNKLTTEHLSDAQKVTYEAHKNREAQNRIAQSIAKIGQAFAPIVEIIANLVANSTAIYGIMGVALLSKVPQLLKFSVGFANNFKDAFKSVKGLVSGIAKMATGGGTGRLKAFFRKSQMDGASEASKLNNKMKPGAGKGTSSGLKGLASGLKAMGTGAAKIALGIGNLALFAVAGALAIPSLVFLAGISVLGVASRVGLNALGSGLMSLGSFAATGIPFLGIALIAALGVAMIPFGYALGQAAPAIKAFGSVILSVFQGLGVIITAAAEGFTKMFGALNSDNMLGLLVLGPALLGISAGLAAMSVTGLLAMPTILALTALGSVAEGLSSIFGEDESSTTSQSSNEMAGVEKKLDTLISLISEGGDVYIDGAKVGKSLQLAGSKVG